MEILKSKIYKINRKNIANGIDLLNDIYSETITCAFFDPQYRGVLDKLKYGNEGKSRSKNRCNLPQMTNDTIVSFLKEYNRILKPSGYLFFWVDKFHLCNNIKEWIKDTDFQIVDLIVWNKMKIGMGYRTRRKSEYCIILQKKPIKVKNSWFLHNIPDVWEEKVNKNHPHSKPIELQKQLILATTKENDFVCDVCAGGYSVFEATQQTNRNFIGGDIIFGE